MLASDYWFYWTTFDSLHFRPNLKAFKGTGKECQRFTVFLKPWMIYTQSKKTIKKATKTLSTAVSLFGRVSISYNCKPEHTYHMTLPIFSIDFTDFLDRPFPGTSVPRNRICLFIASHLWLASFVCSLSISDFTDWFTSFMFHPPPPSADPRQITSFSSPPVYPQNTCEVSLAKNIRQDVMKEKKLTREGLEVGWECVAGLRSPKQALVAE